MANISRLSRQQFSWDAIVLLVATFWLSSSVLLDFFMMPMMYESGMMESSGFAAAGYSMFWLFNRIEVLCAAAIVTGLLVLRQQTQGNRRGQFAILESGSQSRWALMLSGLLLAIALLYTYVFTPQMSAMGLQFIDRTEAPNAMGVLHLLYWGVECLKLAAAAWLVRLCYRDIKSVF